MAAPGMSECGGGGGSRPGASLGPTTLLFPTSISSGKKRGGGPASQVVFNLISLMELVSLSCRFHRSPPSLQPSSSQPTACRVLPWQLGPTKMPLVLSGPCPAAQHPLTHTLMRPLLCCKPSRRGRSVGTVVHAAQVMDRRQSCARSLPCPNTQWPPAQLATAIASGRTVLLGQLCGLACSGGSVIFSLCTQLFYPSSWSDWRNSPSCR